MPKEMTLQGQMRTPLVLYLTSNPREGILKTFTYNCLDAHFNINSSFFGDHAVYLPDKYPQYVRLLNKETGLPCGIRR
jgi:hypothetical protein